MHFIVPIHSLPIRAFLHESAKLVHDLTHRDSSNFQHHRMNFLTVSICIGKKGVHQTSSCQTRTYVPLQLYQRHLRDTSRNGPRDTKEVVLGRRKKLINNSGIPQHVIENIARCLMPDIVAFYESEEGQKEFAAWKAQQQAEPGKDNWAE